MTETFRTQVAYVTGRLLHEGTARPVDGDISLTADEGAIIGKVLDDGRFVISSYERFEELHLKIRATSRQFRAGAVELTHLVVIPAGWNFDPEPPDPLSPLVELGTILLPADSVNIRGRVVRAIDPTVPVASATVSVTHAGPPGSEIAPVDTDADGFYRIDDIHVTAPAEISCSTPGFKTQTRTLLLDFTTPVNEENFRLPPL